MNEVDIEPMVLMSLSMLLYLPLAGYITIDSQSKIIDSNFFYKFFTMFNQNYILNRFFKNLKNNFEFSKMLISNFSLVETMDGTKFPCLDVTLLKK
jgi:hypothetical protein